MKFLYFHSNLLATFLLIANNVSSHVIRDEPINVEVINPDVGHSGNKTSPMPVVLWHGMGDTCCNPLSMGSIKRTIKRQIPGTYVYSVKVGSNVVEDFFNGYLMNVNEQISQICGKIKNHDKLAGGYHAMGFSQGGQFLRGLAERCPDPPMRNLITFGGQHQGVYGLPNCDPVVDSCDASRESVTPLAYSPGIQETITQAEYWHDSTKPDWYRNASVFLPEINNDNVENEEYKENMIKLWNFVMVKFTEDTVVIPRESEWFGFYDDGQGSTVHALENSTLYTEDRLGLKRMEGQGRLVKIPIKGNHLDIPHDDLVDIIDTYITQTTPPANYP